MVKIIGGARYDTATAKEIGYAWSGTGSSDLHNFEEKLYRSKAGKYFLCGEGGAMSRYSWSVGSKIIPMSRAAAQEWAEKNLAVAEYEAIFGEVTDEGGKKARLNIAINPQLRAKLWELAEKRSVTISSLVEGVLAKLV